MTSLHDSYQMIKKPVITEKASDDPLNRNAYHVRVPIEANKVEIRQAIERVFSVKVLSVNTLRNKGKFRRRGRSFGRTQEWKKSMVTLAEGQTIDVL